MLFLLLDGELVAVALRVAQRELSAGSRDAVEEWARARRVVRGHRQGVAAPRPGAAEALLRRGELRRAARGEGQLEVAAAAEVQRTALDGHVRLGRRGGRERAVVDA